MENIGARITEIRKRKGLTQESLSDSAQINLRTLQRIEKSETVPHGDTLRRLCDVLEINIEDVLDYGKKEDVKYIQFFHLSVLAFIVIPLGNIIMPLILWLTKRDKIVNLNEQGINLLNFQILWSLCFYSLLLTYGILRIKSIQDFNFLIYIIGILFLINCFYPMVVSHLIRNGKKNKYYFNPIKFITK